MKKINKQIDVKERVRMVKEAFRLNMDGITANRLRPLGYKLVFGLTYQRIKELSDDIESDAELADRLWGTRQREGMITATLVHPIAEFTQEKTAQWVADLMNEEIAEYLSRNILCQVPFRKALAEEYLQSDNETKRFLAFSIAARMMIGGNGDEDLTNKCLDLAISSAEMLGGNKVSAIAMLLKMSAKSTSTLPKVKSISTQMSQTDNLKLKWISEEVNTFIEYSL